MSAAEQHVETLPEGTLLDGKFRIVRCIGTGGMGAVYEMVHELTRHRRALKLLHKSWASDREAVDRFLREASVAGRIENPHITETFDAGWLASGEPYVVMEYLEGESLADRLSGGTPLPVEEAVRVIAEACRGMHAAHQANIVHRDLKPDNLFLVTSDDCRTFLKLLDFGVSKFDDGASSRATRQGAFVGTPHYMSPEQFLDGRSVDARSDIYSLGVILYEALTGRHPYPVDSFAELATKIITVNPGAPSALRPELPGALDQVVLRAMQKYPQERYPDAEAMALDLEALLRPQTMPQGSFWHADLAETREAVRRRDDVVREQPPSTVAPAPRRGRWVGPFVLAAVAAIAIAVLFAVGGTSGDPTPSTPTVASTATARPTPTDDETAAEATAQAPPTAEPSATAAARPPPPAKAPPPPRATATTKTDHARVDEFPK
jgi:serine/threonine-protein kinase